MLINNQSEYSIDIYCSKKDSEKLKTFKLKIKDQIYQINNFSCPLCENDSNWELVAVSTEGFTWSICKDCGLLQINRRLDDDSLNKFYETGEYQDICMGGLDDEKHFKLEYEIMSKTLISFLHKTNFEIKNKNILEIGCGSGGIVKALTEKGAKVIGFDLDEHRINFGRKYTDKIFVADALSNNIELKNYNLIICSNVLEHLSQPLSFLNGLREKIDNQVEILIDIPNVEGSATYCDESFRRFLHIGHLWYFNSINIERLINHAGFKVKSFSSRGAGMSLRVIPSNKKIQNNNNSYLLTVSAINYANYKLDPNNATPHPQKNSYEHSILSKTKRLGSQVFRRIFRGI